MRTPMGRPIPFPTYDRMATLRKGPKLQFVGPDNTDLPDIYGYECVVGPDSEGIDVGLVEIHMELGSSFPKHVHPDAHIVWVLSGVLGLKVGGAEHTFEKNCAVMVPPNAEHEVAPAAESREKLVILAFSRPYRGPRNPLRCLWVKE